MCHFGGYARDYSRSVVVRKSLARLGVAVVECHSRHPSKARRYVELVGRYQQVYRQVDVILVGTVCHYYMPLAHLLGKVTGKPVIFDVFDSLYETYVFDAAIADPNGIKARYYALVDRCACGLAQLVVLDTPQHADFFARELLVAPHKLRSVWLGVDTDLFCPTLSVNSPMSDFQIVFVGSLLRSHGVDTMIKAAKRLSHLVDVKFKVVGSGPRYHASRGLAMSLGCENIQFLPWVSYDVVPRILAEAAIVLGLFGDTPKVRWVVPNKVYEALAMGKPLVTGDTPAVRALLTHRKNAMLCPLGDDENLAEVILELYSQSDLRREVGQNGLALFRKKFSLEAIGQDWLSVLQEVVGGP